MGIQNILILVDFSDASKQAAEYGLQFAKKVHARVFMQHVYYIPPDVGGDMFVAREAFDGYEESLHQEFDDFKNKIQMTIPEQTRFLIHHGDLIKEMNDVIAQESIDLVIAGNHGRGFFTNILGSNTTKVIQHARCPVLSVPENAVFQPVKRMAFATDMKQTSEKIFSTLIGFTQAFQATIDIIHVSEKKEETLEEPSFLEKALSAVHHTFYYIWAKDIEEGIRQHLEEHHNEILVLVPREHPFFDRLFQKSISRQITYHTHIPLLSIHE